MTEFKIVDSVLSQGELRQFFSYLFAQSSTGIASTGVLTGLGVTQTTTASASVLVGIGLAVGQTSLTAGMDGLVNNAQKTLDVLTANPMGATPRNDLVVFDPADETIKLVVGTPNAIPTDPTPPTGAVLLARLSHAASATTVPTAKITDLRVATSLNYTPTLNRVKISTTADQTLSDATVTVVDFASSTVAYDVGGMADVANDRIVIQKAGWYTFTVRCGFAFNATGSRAVLIEQNSTTVVGDVYASPTPANTGSIGTVVTYTTEPILCAVNDNFRIKVYQSAGGTLPITALNGRRVVFTATQQVGI